LAVAKGSSVSRHPFALLAVELPLKLGAPPFLRQDPGSIGKRGLMTDMLPMPAREICHPISVLVLMKPDNCLFHSLDSSLDGMTSRIRLQ
jgi:hypothetical protein